MKPNSNGHKPVPVSFKRGLVASYASRVHNLFKTYQPVEVSDFLGEHPIFYLLLVMLAEKLRGYYPKTPLILSLEDSGNGEKKLSIQGLAAIDCGDNLVILNEIDEWWWDEVGKTVCNLTIDMFSQELDAPIPSEAVKQKRKKGNDIIFGRR